jgi:hypothetical protein
VDNDSEVIGHSQPGMGFSDTEPVVMVTTAIGEEFSLGRTLAACSKIKGAKNRTMLSFCMFSILASARAPSGANDEVWFAA